MHFAAPTGRGAKFSLRRRHICVFALILLTALPTANFTLAADEASSALAWPAVTTEARPWTRWWWLGSAVDKENLTRLLEEYHNAGIGGVEICPIYGAKGNESRFLPFLSPKWLQMLAHTSSETRRLDMGLDLTCGTGWPFGGPWITAAEASERSVFKTYDVPGSATFKELLPEGTLQCLRAISDSGQQIDLTAQVNDGAVNWTAPAGTWKLYAVSAVSPIQKVKRAAPGGEGNVLDPFSVQSLDKYLAEFDRAFKAYTGAMPRAYFHDSYEYYGASWTPRLFDEFQQRRGYDLREQLPALFGQGPPDSVARVRGDFRQTLSDLHLAYITRWTEWCHQKGSLSRDQAHGSPTNLLDTYAAADIPETEIFGNIETLGVALNKFSSSAAHVSGRRLASSESFTWLTDHFQASLSQVKQAADYLFLTGVNHIFFHGIPYSPQDAPWPGWQFYAAVNFGPQGGLWHDLPEFNAYVTRCQSILQSGSSANDVLLYYPLEDFWNSAGPLIQPNPMPRSFSAAAMKLWNRGYAFDYLSDRFAQQAACADGRVTLGDGKYRVIVVPGCKVMPETTLAKLVELVNDGAMVIVEGALPSDVPGLGNLDSRRMQLKQTLAQIPVSSAPSAQSIQRVPIGKGAFLIGNDLDGLLKEAAVPRESCVDLGLQFVRRTHPQGYHYFIANRGSGATDGWISLGVVAKSAVLLDPRSDDRAGVAAVRKGETGSAQVYLQLQPGESCIIRTFTDQTIAGTRWNYLHPTGAAQPIAGTWKVQFIEGGPALPPSFETQTLASWTTLGQEPSRFAGTARYTITFDHPPEDAADWVLDLGKVCESARVKVNDHAVHGFWCAPFRMNVGQWLVPGKNTLDVEVTNLAINRIADMDRHHQNWKYFYDANVATHLGRGVFDASKLPPRDSGLLGPVQLIPMARTEVATTGR